MRLGVANRNVIAKFIEVANKLEWPIYLHQADKIKRDKLFPEPKTLVDGLDEWGFYYQIEKREGKWQIQRVDINDVKPVTKWQSTRVFLKAIELLEDVYKEKRDQ